MKYVKTEQELFEGRKKKQEIQDANLRRLFEESFYEDCTFLLRGMRGLKEEQTYHQTIKIPVIA